MDEFDNLVTQLQQVTGDLSGVVRNPPQVSAPEKTSGSETSLRSFSPGDIAEMARTHAQSSASAVTSVFGRTGAVIPSFGDYNADQIAEGAAKVVMTIAERAKLANLPLSVRDYGAVGDGTTDDTTAIRAAVAAAESANRPLYFPAGTYCFTSTITVTRQRAAWVGEGPYQTILRYIGASTTPDLVVFGDGVNQILGCYLDGFRITSSTRMTAGCGLRLRKFGRGTLRNIVLDGQDGPGTLSNGLYFDEVDTTSWDNGEACAQLTAVAVRGGAGPYGNKSDLQFSNVKISGAQYGLHIGGGFGGFYISNSDIIWNDVNVLIDETLTDEVNREVFFGLMACDSPRVGPNVLINSTKQGEALYQFANTWICGSRYTSGIGLHVKAANGARLMVNGCRLYDNHGDAVRIDSTNCVGIISGCSITTNWGYGINLPPTHAIVIGANAFANNKAGNVG